MRFGIWTSTDAAAGVDELIVPDFTLGGQAQVLEAIDQLGREVLAVSR